MRRDRRTGMERRRRERRETLESHIRNALQIMELAAFKGAEEDAVPSLVEMRAVVTRLRAALRLVVIQRGGH